MKLLPLLLILLILSTPAIADKNKGIFSGEILKDDLADYTSNVADTPGHISDNQSPVQSELQNVYDWMNIGKTQLKLGNWKPAEETFFKVIDQEPKNTEGWEGYLLSIRGGGNFDKLLEASEKATKENPDFASAWKYNGIALCSLDQSEEALSAFDRALQAEPDYYTAWYYKGIALDSLKRYEESILAYDEVVAQNPKYVKAWNNKGVALSQIGRYDEAIVAYDKALEIDPEYQMALKNKEAVQIVKQKNELNTIDVIDDSAEFKPPEIEEESTEEISINSASSTVVSSVSPSPTVTQELQKTNEDSSITYPTSPPCGVYKTDTRSSFLEQGQATIYGYYIPIDGRSMIEWSLDSKGTDNSGKNLPIFDLYTCKDCNPQNNFCTTEYYSNGPNSHISIIPPNPGSTYYVMVYARSGSSNYNLIMNSYKCPIDTSNTFSGNSEKSEANGVSTKQKVSLPPAEFIISN